MLADATDMLERFEYHPLGDNTAWRSGYLWISQKFEHSSMHDGDKEELDVAEALDELLGHPPTRFLRELTVGIESYEDNGYSGIAKIIGTRVKPTLRKLILGDFYSEKTELSWSHIGDVAPIYKARRNLESLTLRSGGVKFGTIDLPKLKELRIITGELDKGAFKSVMSAKLPGLERLDLQLGEELQFEIPDLQPIFDGKLFPELEHLGLGNSLQGDAICAALASSKIASQLKSLDMAKGTLKLASIGVTRCHLTNTGIAQLNKIAKAIEGAKNQKQEDDPGDRYTSGRE